MVSFKPFSIHSFGFYLAACVLFWPPSTTGGLVVPKSYECPKSDLSQNITFYLYSSKIQDRFQLLPNNKSNLIQSGLNPGTGTKLITHGFNESPGYCNSTSTIIKAFKNHTDFNLILIDWSDLSGTKATDYPLVVSCLKSGLAAYVGSFIKYLIGEGGVDKEKMHLIGHSLGAHLLGIATHQLDFKIPRITALDPAGPFFDHVAPKADKLDKDDALIVDVIHTNSLILGSEGPDGTFDFYANGGTAQPNCSVHKVAGQNVAVDSWSVFTSVVGSILHNALVSAVTTGGCDHARSYQIFAKSINPSNKFLCSQCNTVQQARNQKCEGKMGYAGYYLNKTEPGVYYLNTDPYRFPNLDIKVESFLPSTIGRYSPS
uniref:Pancreatic lipase-related protein 2 n=2 Tax=Cacopsylla melanoneura TaxID=428564 RepID=A0A8D9E509_9HEMI